MTGVVTTTILSGSSTMNPEYSLMSIDIIKEVNKIPLAQIVLLDGEAPKQTFAISDTDFFKPGNNLEIKLRYEGEVQNEATVFKGIIIKHSLQIDQSSSLLIVDLKDISIKLTTQRKSAVFRDMTDQKIIEEIVKKSGIQVTAIATTNTTHKEMVQYYCTDWDFILSRIDVNGLWMLADDGQITIKEPNFPELPKHTFEYGNSDIYEFEMEADIRHQYKQVKSQFWDINNQTQATSVAEKFALKQGNLQGDVLSEAIGAEEINLVSPGQLDDSEIQAWADAKLLKSRLSMLKGRLKVPGFADIKPGDFMEITGIGQRFNGKTLVTGIRHQVNAQGWQTDVQFGLSADFFAEQNKNIIDTPAAGLIPAINGLQIGIVDQFEQDPNKQFRVKVKIPSIETEETDGVVWARLASVESGNKRGIFFRPELGDEVIIGFINDDPRQAIILGSVYSQKNALPPGLEITQENYKKGIVTKEGLQIIFDDENKLIQISTLKGNVIKLSEKDKGINLEDENGNRMIMDDKGVQIQSSKDIVIEGKNITLKGSKVDVN